jgi:hypothetical protein
VAVDFRVTSDGAGYGFEWSSDDPEIIGDTWHETLDDALEQAQLSFGIHPSEWQVVEE